MRVLVERGISKYKLLFKYALNQISSTPTMPVKNASQRHTHQQISSFIASDAMLFKPQADGIISFTNKSIHIYNCNHNSNKPFNFIVLFETFHLLRIGITFMQTYQTKQELLNV